MSEEKKIISRQEAQSLGLKRYFTGKSCKHGHIDERTIGSCSCFTCLRLASSRKVKGVKRHRLTDEELISCIDSFSSYSEFRASKEYSTALKRGFGEYAISVLGFGLTTKRWNAETCISEAKKYSSRSDFSKGSSGAYDAALSIGILEDCCKHMTRPLTDADVVYMWGEKRINDYICKIGITSSRLGYERIVSVSRKSSVSLDFCYMIKTNDARCIEKEILNSSLEFDVGEDINGWTEFRVISSTDMNEILRMYEWNSVAPSGLGQELAELQALRSEQS